MTLFADFMRDLSERRAVRRETEGTVARYRMRLSGTAAATVTVDELDTASAGRVTSEAWPVPVTSGAYAEFMRAALQFNRSALTYLDAGVVQDPANPSLYRLTWFVPSADASAAEWTRRLKLFGKLVDKAWSDLPAPGRSAMRRTGGDEGHVIFMP